MFNCQQSVAAAAAAAAHVVRPPLIFFGGTSNFAALNYFGPPPGCVSHVTLRCGQSARTCTCTVCGFGRVNGELRCKSAVTHADADFNRKTRFRIPGVFIVHARRLSAGSPKVRQHRRTRYTLGDRRCMVSERYWYCCCCNYVARSAVDRLLSTYGHSIVGRSRRCMQNKN